MCDSGQQKVEEKLPEETLKRWESEQAALKLQVIENNTEEWQEDPLFCGLERVAGVDLSFIKGDDVTACAMLVVLSYPELEVLYEDCQMVAITAPYIAGFLAFRETPFLVEAVLRLQREKPSLVPQVIFVDGNGLLHHRGFGLACHLGVLTRLPCIGVAKNLLLVPGAPGKEEFKDQVKAMQKAGDSFSVTDTCGRVLGKALRSCDKSTKPIFVSVGHQISLDSALRLTQSCCRHRIPEPIRQADIRSREFLRKHFSCGEPSGDSSQDAQNVTEHKPKSDPQEES
ncbi:endonuclease V-like isoform X2 [Erpetoichthys calabaricus]|uniref:endonuclease V-like isoform X2 n=1 Tax=Erpetoichthys calabaricus TaxID=27687 RepID=UPI002234030A|nr:endonuclease V-like isoform X2 [Erpetoichthys calabaricus]